MSPGRPNILFITSDQQRADCYGFEGRRIRTPHLDAMAQAGTRFSACITPNLVCQPSRASMLTGLLPLTHGVSDNGIELDAALGEAGFAGTLARAGWRTGFVGKAHFATSHTFAPTGTPECRNSDQPQDWNGPYMGFQHVELMVEGHNHWPPMKPPRGQHYERWFHKDGRGEALQRLYDTRLPPHTSAVQTFHSGLPPAFHNSTWIGDRSIAFLNAQASAKAPFCLWASFPDPHHPFDAPEPWSRLHDPEDVDLPVHRTLDLERRPWWHRQSLEGKPLIVEHLRKIRENYSRIPTQSDAELRALIANYYGMISLIDHNVGRILLALDDLGLAQDTLVVFSTDHGDWLGDHGLILKGPMAYEGLLRVGLILRGPGVPAGKVVADPVSTLDLPATFADYAGVPMPGAKHSRSLRALVETDGASRDFALSEWDLRASRSGVDVDLRTVRAKTAKLTLDRISGAGELYDLANDPHEMDNRFDDPGCATLQRELTDMIRSRPDDIRPRLPQVGMA
ncbi:MAG TPA: sulfatase-like hydrolase/transferase [Burkholderiales bacterium]